jgi:hypothetical protein
VSYEHLIGVIFDKPLFVDEAAVNGMETLVQLGGDEVFVDPRGELSHVGNRTACRRQYDRSERARRDRKSGLPYITVYVMEDRGR